jgi:hypothetical protein
MFLDEKYHWKSSKADIYGNYINFMGFIQKTWK